MKSSLYSLQGDSGTYDLVGVPVSHVPDVWDQSAHYIQAALERTEGEISLTDVRKSIMGRDMQLWVTIERGNITGALVTQLIEYPQTKACRYVALGGDLHGDFNQIDDVITRWAMHNECDRVELVGRRGWVRAMKNNGYTEAYSFVTKKVV